MNTPVKTIPKWLGPVIVIGAILMMAYGKTSPGVPPWIGYAASSVFLLAGLSITAQAFGNLFIAKLIGPLIVIALAGIATWIGFGAGERQCTTNVALFWSGSGAAGCKSVFAIAAVLLWIFLLAALWSNHFRKHPQRKSLEDEQ